MIQKTCTATGKPKRGKFNEQGSKSRSKDFISVTITNKIEKN